MAPALTLIVPTGKPPEEWTNVPVASAQAAEVGGEVLIACGGHLSSPPPPAPCRVLHVPGANVFQLRAAAIAAACGEVVAILEDHNELAADFCTRLLAAFDAHPEADGVVGTATNGSPGHLNQASFLLTFAPFLAPLEEVPRDRCPPPGIVAFRRAAIPAGVPAPGWLEYQMVDELRSTGRLVADDRVHISHVQPVGWQAFWLQFHSGRSYGGIRHEPRASLSKRHRLREAVTLPVALMRQTRVGLRRAGRRESWACMIALAAMTTCNALGQIVGVLLGPGKSPARLE